MISYKKKANPDLREMAREHNVPQYEIAHRCGVDEGTLCRWLRYELPADDERRQKIIQAIKEGGRMNE